MFHPGNRMDLPPGRVEEMIREAEANNTAIICHSTLGTDENAVCRGFFDLYPTQTLQIAERLGFIQLQESS